MKRYLSPQDASFLRMDTRRTPMHVGALLVFKLPENARPDFLRDLLLHMRTRPFLPSPFDCKLNRTTFGRMLPSWEPATVDTDYHVRHSALPYPGGERELGQLVERLHSQPLDLSRPVWEVHLIEGLENRRFAFYFKAHHCAIDGMGAMKMVNHWLSNDPADMSGPGVPREVPRDDSAPAPAPQTGLLRKLLKGTRGNAKAVSELLKTFYQLGQGGEDSVLRAASTTPRTLFNVPVTQQRRLGTQLLDLSRFKAVSAATGASVNDIALALCAGAVRRYLLERDALPGPSLTASVPIGLPRGPGGGNAVTGFVCPLGTDEADPLLRLEKIARITDRTKKQMLSMSPTALEQVALLGMSPLILGQMTGVLPRIKPFFNFVVSNVVASKTLLYLRGAEMEAMYPVSFLFDGYALNVTIIGYAGRVAVGFVGCRDAIPRLQRLAVYTGDALTELEQAVQGRGAPPAKRKKARA